MILQKFGMASLAMALSLSLVAAPDLAHAGKKERSIALGIGLGLLGGAIVSNGDPRAALGGAVAGGLIGGVAAKDDRRSWRDDRRDWHRGPPSRHQHHQERPRPRY